MGLKIHVAEIYQVRYHTSSVSFINQQEVVNRLLFNYCPGISYSGDDVTYAERIEVPRDELAKLVAIIVCNAPDFERKVKEYGGNIKAKDAISVIAKWIADSDQRNDFVVLEWF